MSLPSAESLLKFHCIDSLLQSPPYAIDVHAVDVKMDQNESPWDWPPSWKEKVCDRLKAASWNRYPEAFPADLKDKVARWVGVDASEVLIGSGTDSLIGAIYSAVGKTGKTVFASPSFPLFAVRAKYEGMACQPWVLDEHFQYDLKRLPDLEAGDKVIFASPNNPTGSTLDRAVLQGLLRKHPQVLFIADEAYFEFVEDTFLSDVKNHPNLIVTRTFSKCLNSAGVRFGYLVGAREWVREIGKFIYPFALNHFAYHAASLILEDPEIQDELQRRTNSLRQLRDEALARCRDIGESRGFVAFPSEANFFLMRFEGYTCQQVYQRLIANGILVRDVSGGPGLTGCLRVSIGTDVEMERFFSSL